MQVQDVEQARQGGARANSAGGVDLHGQRRGVVPDQQRSREQGLALHDEERELSFP